MAKLDGERLRTIGEGGIDALVRTGLKGPYDAKKGQPVVAAVEKVLQQTRVRYLVGEITVVGVDRNFDCVVPDESQPHVLIEVGVFATTARELSEKGLVEQHLRNQIRDRYPATVVVRVLDGMGWIARGGKALANVVAASDYVFTQKTVDGLTRVIHAHVPKSCFV
ncbi:MAG: hypothetical protein HYS13_06435 [Planctomycetia bacterium]|nr:hypothetical protein [Planctomycetia bacterium]